MGAIIDYGDYTINPISFLPKTYAAGEQFFNALAYHPCQYTLKFSDLVTVANSPMLQLMELRKVMVTAGEAQHRPTSPTCRRSGRSSPIPGRCTSTPRATAAWAAIRPTTRPVSFARIGRPRPAQQVVQSGGSVLARAEGPFANGYQDFRPSVPYRD